MKSYIKNAIGWSLLFLIFFGIAGYFWGVTIGIAVAVIGIIGLMLIKIKRKANNNSI